MHLYTKITDIFMLPVYVVWHYFSFGLWIQIEMFYIQVNLSFSAAKRS